MCEKCDKLKQIIINYINSRSFDDRKKPYMLSHERAYSLNDLLCEIENDTEVWKKLESDLYLLTLDLLSRQVINI